MNFLDRFLTPKKTFDNSSEEIFLEHLDKIFRKDPILYRGEKLREDVPSVSAMAYRDIPEQGIITGVTYGLSIVKHPDWADNRTELCISVESESLDWVQVAGYIANKMRGEFPFLYGQTLNFGEPISYDSQMDAFLIFAPGIFEKDQYLDIDIKADYNISLTALYPIYSSEIEIIKKIGLEKFWAHPDFDPFDVKRKPITDI